MNNPHRRSISQNQRPFENCWNVTYKKPNYDALADPHATYYFMNRSMKKHLKGLRKVNPVPRSQLSARASSYKKNQLRPISVGASSSTTPLAAQSITNTPSNLLNRSLLLPAWHSQRSETMTTNKCIRRGGSAAQ